MAEEDNDDEDDGEDEDVVHRERLLHQVSNEVLCGLGAIVPIELHADTEEDGEDDPDERPGGRLLDRDYVGPVAAKEPKVDGECADEEDRETQPKRGKEFTLAHQAPFNANDTNVPPLDGRRGGVRGLAGVWSRW